MLGLDKFEGIKLWHDSVIWRQSEERKKSKETFTISLDNAVEQKQVKVEPIEGVMKVKINE